MPHKRILAPILLTTITPFIFCQEPGDYAEQLKLAASMETAYANGDIGNETFAAAVLIYRRGAEFGNADAMYRLGCCYYMGKGTAIDIPKALNLLYAAANKGHLPARNLHFDILLERYYLYLADPPDFASSRAPIEKLATEGNAEAAARLGIMHDRGLGGIKKNTAKALELFRTADAKGSLLGKFFLGRYYLDGKGGLEKDNLKGLFLADEAARSGCCEALFFMGKWYVTASGVNADPNKGMTYLVYAADMGNSRAMNELGYCLDTGKAGRINRSEAARWIRMAAERDNRRSQHNLGLLLVDGRGIEKSPAEGVQWFLKSAEKGFAPAMYSLGHCFEKGTGVDADINEAFNWYLKGANAGDIDSIRKVGEAFRDGNKGTPVSWAQALQWYEKGAAKGDGSCMNILGIMHLNGEGCAKDEKKTRDYFKAAADKGNRAGLYNMGLGHEKGLWGMPKNRDEAIEYYRKAAKAGHPTAMQRLTAMNAK